jgi:hypothetical protein
MADMTLDITEEMRESARRSPMTFAALLDELGPENRGMEERPMPMVLEAWPGGRWYRDLGDGNGHLLGPCAGHPSADAAGDQLARS